MRTRKEKPIFRGLTIAGAGPLGGSEQWTDANIARWVGLRAGKFVRVGSGSCSGSGVENGKEKGKGKGDRDGIGGTGGGGACCGDDKLSGLGEEVTHVVCTREEFRRMGGVGKSRSVLFCFGAWGRSAVGLMV
jgi:hypothetical protein